MPTQRDFGASPNGSAAASHRCPVCERIRDGVPASELTLSSGYLTTNSEEVMRLANNTDERMHLMRQLQRLIDTSGAPATGLVRLRFTGIHATHGLGMALVKAFGGALEAPYPDAGSPMRARWKRDRAARGLCDVLDGRTVSE